MNELKSLRNEVDRINIQILELLNKRAAIVQQIGKIKKSEGRLTPFDPDREAEILENLFRKNTGPFENEMIENIYKMIFKESKKLQK